MQVGFIGSRGRVDCVGRGIGIFGGLEKDKIVRTGR